MSPAGTVPVSSSAGCRGASELLRLGLPDLDDDPIWVSHHHELAVRQLQHLYPVSVEARGRGRRHEAVLQERGGPALVGVQPARPRRSPVSVRRRPFAARAGGRRIGYPLSVWEGSSPNSRR
jgi:hypothetical protein